MTRLEHLLWILSEECDEVGQRASKAARFGLAEVQPGQPFSNAWRIRQEFGDLIAAYEMLGIEMPSRVEIEEKKIKVEKFLKYSAECGTLTP